MALNDRFIDKKTGQFAISWLDLKKFYETYAEDLGSDYKWDTSWDNLGAKELWKRTTTNGKKTWVNPEYIKLWQKAKDFFSSLPEADADGNLPENRPYFQVIDQGKTKDGYAVGTPITIQNNGQAVTVPDWRQAGYYNWEGMVDLAGKKREEAYSMADKEAILNRLSEARTNDMNEADAHAYAYRGVYDGAGKQVSQYDVDPSKFTQLVSMGRDLKSTNNLNNANRRDVRALVRKYSDSGSAYNTNLETGLSNSGMRHLARHAINGNFNNRATREALEAAGLGTDFSGSQVRAYRDALNYHLGDNTEWDQSIADKSFGEGTVTLENINKLRELLGQQALTARAVASKRIGGKLIKRKIFIK